MLLVILGLGVIANIAGPLLRVPEPIGRNHNEGWNAFHATFITRPADLYPPLDALVSNTYPPLSFAIVAAVSQGGDTLRTGRAVAVVALFIVVSCVGWIARMLTSSRITGWLSGMLAMGSLGAHYQNYVALDDPQMLGHAFQYAGLALFMSRGERRGPMIASVLLLLAGGLVKHNLLAIPLATMVWLFANRRPNRVAWLLAALVLCTLAFLLLALIFGPTLFLSIFRHPRTYDFALLPARALEDWFVPITPLLIGGLVVVLLPGSDRRIDLVLTVAAVSLGLTVLTSMARGMSYNAIFDLVFALSILCGIAAHELARLSGEPGAPAHDRVLCVAIVAFSSSILLASPMRAYRAFEAFSDRYTRERIAREDIEFVRSQPGDAICEDPAVCYWAGKSFQVDFFNLSQKLAAGALDGSSLVDRLAREEFATIQLDRSGGSAFLSQSMNQTLLEHYALARTSRVNGYFYVPRTPSPSR